MKLIYEMQYKFVILQHQNKCTEAMKDINSCNILKLEDMIEKAANLAIVTHTKPDGDAMGSTIALYHYLTSIGKKSRIVINDEAPSYLDFITNEICEGDLVIHSQNPEAASSAIAAADLVICLDFNAFHRTENLETPLFCSSAEKILIDHHLNPDREQFALCFSETQVSSASELLYHILMALPDIGNDTGKLPAQATEALMTGMTTDTNNFANSVFPSTLLMASALLAAGVDRDKILLHLYNQHSESRLRLMGHVMKDLMTITEDGVAYIVLDSKTQKEYDVKEGDTGGFVNMPLSIARVRMSLFLKEDGNRIRVSIRSKKGTSANQCAKLFFNGGGHENAAGGRLYIPENVNRIEEAGEYIEKYTHIYFTEYEKNN